MSSRQRPGPSSRKHDPYAAFRVRDYRVFLFTSVLTQIGGGVRATAIGWEVYARTGEPFSLGMVGLAQAVPMLLLTLFAGHLADQRDRRSLIVISTIGDALMSVCLAWISITQAPVPLVFVVLFVDAGFRSLGWPARSALMPLLVPPHVFENAVKWRTTLGQISSMLGPAAGGFIIAASIPAAYLLAAASAMVFVLAIKRLKMTQQQDREAAKASRDLLGGIRYVRNTPPLLAAISLDLFAVLFGGAVYLLPIYAKDILDVGEAGFGWLRMAPAAGAFCTAFVLTQLPPMRKAGRNMLLAVAGFGVATIVFGLSRSFWLSLGMLFLTGVFDNVSVVVRQTMIQMRTPDHMRGRVSAVSAVFVSSSNELGGLESGTVAHLFGPVVSVVSGGVGTIVVVLTMAWRSPALRRFGALTEKATPIEQEAQTSATTDLAGGS